MALDRFSPAVREWFASTFPEPTAAQAQGWPAIAAGAPHPDPGARPGSGKTLAAFLWGIDRLVTSPPPETKERRTRLLYLSPLRALAFDVEKNLRAPLTGIQLAAERLGVPFTEPTVGAAHRRHVGRGAPGAHPPPARPPHHHAREPVPHAHVRGPGHACAASRPSSSTRSTPWRPPSAARTWRCRWSGSTRCASGRRSASGCRPPSGPLEEVARFLGGYDGPGRSPARSPSSTPASASRSSSRSSCPSRTWATSASVLDEPASGPAAGGPARKSIWPSRLPPHPRAGAGPPHHHHLLQRPPAGRAPGGPPQRAGRRPRASCRRGTRRAGQGPPRLAGPRAAGRHRGPAEAGRAARPGRHLPASSSASTWAPSTSSSRSSRPGAVSRGLQRIGRAGHQVGEPSRGKIFPKHRGDLLEAAVVAAAHARRPHRGDPLPPQPARRAGPADRGHHGDGGLGRRRAGRPRAPGAPASPTSPTTCSHAVLDLLAGRYPSRRVRRAAAPHRVGPRRRPRPGPRRRQAAGGHQRRHHPRPWPVRRVPARRHPRRRARRGDGLREPRRARRSCSARQHVAHRGHHLRAGRGHARRRASPARCRSGTATGRGRPLELGRALGAFVREVRRWRRSRPRRRPRCTTDDGLDALGGRQRRALPRRAGRGHRASCPTTGPSWSSASATRSATGGSACSRPFGTPVHAPWAMAIERRLARPLRHGRRDDVERRRHRDPPARGGRRAAGGRDLLVDPDEIEELVRRRRCRPRRCSRPASGSARPGPCCCPAAGPTRRTPLWQQRQRAADLLAVAAKYPTLPDPARGQPGVPAGRVRRARAARRCWPTCEPRRIRLVAVDTPKASPFAQCLLFSWIATYMYEGDAPLAERRAAALALDRDLLRELLGAEELRELIDADVLADLELELQCLVDAPAGPLGRRGPRPAAPPRRPHAGRARRRAATAGRGGRLGRRSWWPSGAPSRLRIAGEERFAAAEDAARYRDALGAALPLGLPAAFTEPGRAPARAARRPLRPHPRARSARPAPAPGASACRSSGSRAPCERLEAEGRVVRGEFRPDGVEREWCDTDVLRQLRRRSLAALRREVEPVEPAALARFLPRLAGRGRRVGAGSRRWSRRSACCRARPSRPRALDARRPAGPGGRATARPTSTRSAPPASWCGSAPAPSGAERRAGAAVLPRPGPPLLAPPRPDVADRPTGALHDALREHLGDRGASFWCDLRGRARRAPPTPSCWPRCGTWCGRARSPTTRWRRCGRFVGGAGGPAHRRRRAGAAARRPRPGRLTRTGPARRAPGRWSLVRAAAGARAVAHRGRPTPGPASCSSATACSPGRRRWPRASRAGSPRVYGVLKVLEERGQVRRGYFVAGLGAAQFALPGAVDRLRAARDARCRRRRPLVLAATDPAQPYGAALAWPRRPRPVARRGPPGAGRARWPAGEPGRLARDRRGHQPAHLPGGRRRRRAGSTPSSPWSRTAGCAAWRSRTIDGGPASTSPVGAGRCGRPGFADGYRGLVLRGS